jgi:hypothetical protein
MSHLADYIHYNYNTSVKFKKSPFFATVSNLRRPYTKVTIGNMFPATFFINVAGH